MKGWSIKRYPTACSFGIKLLLLAGAAGFLSFAGLLQGPSFESEILQQADTSSGRLSARGTMTGADVGPVDLNRSSAEELRRLPGIGPVLAERVVRYRRENGKFPSIRDIQNVKGIGVKRFERLEPLIHIGQKISLPGE